MEQKVIDYFDIYLGGRLNESTTNEQLEQAALDLVILTEAVIEFYESVYGAAHRVGHLKQMRKHLKRPFLGVGWTPSGKQRNANRRIMGQTPEGTAELAKIDKTGLIKTAERGLKAEIEKDPTAITSIKSMMAKGGPEHERGLKAGKLQAKTDLATMSKKGRQAKRAKSYAGLSTQGSADAGRGLGKVLGTRKIVTDEDIKYYKKDEEEESQIMAKKKRGRDVLPAGAEFVAPKHRQELKARKYEKDYERARTSGKQLSFMAGAGKIGQKAKRWTTKSGREVEAETKRAAAEAGSIMDIVRKHSTPQVKHREKMGGTRGEREAKGQGRLF